jgi:hypothetical protein
LGKLINKILEDPKGTVDAVKGLAQGIEDIGKASGDAWENLSKFTKAYDDFASFIDKHEGSGSGTDDYKGISFLPSSGQVRKGMNAVVKAFKGGVSRLKTAASEAGEHIAGPFKDLWGKIGPSVRAVVSKTVSVMKSLPGKVTGAIRSLGNRIASVWDSAYNAAVGGARSVVNGAIRIIRQLPGKVASALHSVAARVKGAFSGAGSWLVSAGRRIISGLISGIKAMAGAAGSAAANVVRHAISVAKSLIPGRASGGNVSSTAAGGGARGGQVLVGEQGPEIVDLPFGSHVNSNADSRRIGMGSGGGGGGVHFHFHGPVYGDHNALKRALVNMKRAGDLDLVLR